MNSKFSQFITNAQNTTYSAFIARSAETS